MTVTLRLGVTDSAAGGLGRVRTVARIESRLPVPAWHGVDGVVCLVEVAGCVDEVVVRVECPGRGGLTRLIERRPCVQHLVHATAGGGRGQEGEEGEGEEEQRRQHGEEEEEAKEGGGRARWKKEDERDE